MDKDSILKMVSDLSVEQLVNYISNGSVELSDLMNTGELDATKRRSITKLLAIMDSEDDEDWEKYRLTELGCSEYILKHPNGKHVEDAKEKINLFEHSRRELHNRKVEILDKLKRNPNSFSPGMLKDYFNKGVLNESDLINCNIPERVIGQLNEILTGSKSTRLELGETPDLIPSGYTEVYFWGIPGSGKTCALASILSTAYKLGYLDIAIGPGYEYMTRLKNIFLDEVATLPPPSPVESTQYLPFVLKKEKDKPRSVSLIELSGEIFQCFFRKNANLRFQSKQHEDTFNSLMRFLKGGNRKIHFFFIDYDKENKMDIDGFTQSDYLDAASVYFKNNEIFDRTTDAIYLVMTKSDLMPDAKNYHERVEYSKSHLKTNNFIAFTNTLKERCKQYSINAGRLTIEPFSLGKVYFQQICEFDSTSAKKIIDILFERIPPKRKSLLDVLNK